MSSSLLLRWGSPYFCDGGYLVSLPWMSLPRPWTIFVRHGRNSSHGPLLVELERMVLLLKNLVGVLYRLESPWTLILGVFWASFSLSWAGGPGAERIQRALYMVLQ